MDRMLVLVLGAALAALALEPAPPPARPEGAPTVLAHRASHYLEDERTGRVLADVQARVLRQGGEVRLRVAVSPFGDQVDPEPGFRGLRGVNRITATELRDILRDARGTVTTRSSTGRARSGSFRTTRTGRLPVRRIGPDGRLLLDAETEVLPTEAVIDSGVVGDGRHETVLSVDGHPRLSVRFSVRGARAVIHDVTSLSVHGRDLP